MSVQEGEGVNSTQGHVQGVHFASFDTSVQMRIRGSAAEMTRWMSDSSISCKWPAGASLGAQEVAATVGLATDTFSGSFTYN
eukprot:1207535-Rhodomonas_salina.6